LRVSSEYCASKFIRGFYGKNVSAQFVSSTLRRHDGDFEENNSRCGGVSAERRIFQFAALSRNISTIFRFFSWVIIYVIACVILNFPDFVSPTGSMKHPLAAALISGLAIGFIICDIFQRGRKKKASESLCKHLIRELFPSRSPHTTETEEERRRISVEWRTKFAAKHMFRSMVVISLFIPLLHPQNWPCGSESLPLDLGLFGFSLLGWSLMHLEHLETVVQPKHGDENPAKGTKPKV
jgi:hypothetical protein